MRTMNRGSYQVEWVWERERDENEKLKRKYKFEKFMLIGNSRESGSHGYEIYNLFRHKC